MEETHCIYPSLFPSNTEKFNTLFKTSKAYELIYCPAGYN